MSKRTVKPEVTTLTIDQLTPEQRAELINSLTDTESAIVAEQHKSTLQKQVADLVADNRTVSSRIRAKYQPEIDKLVAPIEAQIDAEIKTETAENTAKIKAIQEKDSSIKAGTKGHKGASVDIRAGLWYIPGDQFLKILSLMSGKDIDSGLKAVKADSIAGNDFGRYGKRIRRIHGMKFVHENSDYFDRLPENVKSAINAFVAK